jgi:hypothetical protein
VVLREGLLPFQFAEEVAGFEKARILPLADFLKRLLGASMQYLAIAGCYSGRLFDRGNWMGKYNAAMSHLVFSMRTRVLILITCALIALTAILLLSFVHLRAAYNPSGPFWWRSQ